jgi:hypothetical protein
VLRADLGACPWWRCRGMTQGVGAQTSAGLLAFQFVWAASIEATGHVAGVTENAVIRRGALFPDPAVYSDAGATYGRAAPHAPPLMRRFSMTIL